MKAGSLVALALANLSVIGCATTVSIESPKAGASSAGVYDFVAKFHPDFKPGTFKATLIGGGTSQVYTGSFTPAPAPGGTSKAPASGFKMGNYELGVSGDFDRPQRLFEGLGQNVQFTPPAPGFQGPSPTPTLGTCPPSSPYQQCQPPFIRLKQGGAAVTMSVVAASPPPTALVVTLTPRSTCCAPPAGISLNGNPTGAAITLTILSGQTTANFTIHGDLADEFAIKISVPGHQEQDLFGRVN